MGNTVVPLKNHKEMAQSAVAVEYTDSISTEW